VSLPGRGARVVDPPVSEPAVLLQQLLVALVPHLDRPYAFFGHSMGGLLGAELTQRLKQVQYPAPRRLWLSGCTPPHASPAWEPISHLPDEEFLARLGDFGGTPPALLENREFMAMLLPALRADFSFCEKYRGRTLPPLDPPLSIFGGSRDTLAPRAALEGWRSYSRQALDVQIFEGDHFFLGQQTAQVARAVFSRMSEPGFLPA
jgi:medium-chain acyl-[acyl-carrier-protein] hydrolase